MDQPGMVANPARGQLNSENDFSLSPFATDILVSRDGSGHPAPSPVSPLILQTRARYFLLSATASKYCTQYSTVYCQPPSGQSRVYRITQLRTDDVHCREIAGTGSLVLKVVRVTGLPFQVSPWTNFCAPLFFRTADVCKSSVYCTSIS